MKRFAKERPLKKDLIVRLRDLTHLTEKEAEFVFHSVIKVIEDAICDPDVSEVPIGNIGKFNIKMSSDKLTYKDFSDGVIKKSKPRPVMTFQGFPGFKKDMKRIRELLTEDRNK